MKHTIKAIKGSLPLILTSSILQGQSPELLPFEIDPTLVEGALGRNSDEGEEKVAQSNQVTAFLTGTSLKDTPQAVTIFTKEQIQQQGIDSVADVIDYTPGVVNSQGEGHRDAVVFRGVRSTADFFVDGVRDDVQYYRSLYNVDQVEILKGANALNFGRGGSGGVFNRVAKKAIIGEEFGQIQSSIDTFGANSSQFDYNKSVGDRGAFRLNVHFDNLENHRDLFEGERIGINPTFTYQLAESTQLRFTYEYADHERFIDRGIPNFDGGPAEELDGETFGDTDLNFNDLESHTFRVSLDHEFNDNWKGRLNAFYGKYDKVYSNYFASDYERDLNEIELDGYIDTTDRERFSISGDLVGEFSTGPIEHKVLFGGEYINTSSDQDRLNNVFDITNDDQAFFSLDNGLTLSNGVARDDSGNILGTGTFSDVNDDTESTLNVFSFFLQDEIKITDKLDVILGARFDSFDIEVVDNEVGGLGTLTQTENEVTPRFGIVYRPIEELSLFASYSESFLPSSGEQFTDLVDNGQPANDLDPNTSSNLEFGAKWDVLDNLALSVSAFRLEQDAAVNGSVAGTLERLDSRVYGVEAQLKGEILDQWYLSFGYSYLEGEQFTDDPTTDGNNLRELPRHTFSLWNNFKLSEKLNVGLGAIYQDETFVDFENEITLPSFFRVDASVSYEINESLGVQLNLENLFSEDYFPSSHNDDNITVGAPLSARLTFTGRF